MCKETSRMDSESEELYLMKLKRFILDEDKIVTALWLSKEYNIDIHASHALLKQFVDDQKSGNNNRKLGISYTLIGNNKDTDAFSVMIVNDDQLEEKKKLFKDCTEEIHSIQKAKDVIFNMIGLVDMFDIHGEKGVLSGCIVSKNCVLRTNLPNRVLPTVTRAAGTDKSKASHLFAGKTNVSPASTSASTNKKEKPTKTDEKSVKTEQKSEKVEETKSDKKTEKKLTKQKSDEKKSGSNAIANMFAKAPPPKEKKPEPVKTEAMDIDDEDTEEDEQIAFTTTIKKGPKVEPKKEGKSELYDSGTDEEAQKIEAANKAKGKSVKGSADNEKASSKKKVTRTKRQRDQSVEKPQKKRKRIVQHVESDDDIFADEEDDEHEASASNVIISDDDVSPVKPTQSKTLAPKNRKRKFVQNTYEDEEGYMVTEKEVVYESADSEEDKENPPPPKQEQTKKPAPQKTVKEPSPPTKKKKTAAKAANQPTLMNFFKKK